MRIVQTFEEIKVKRTYRWKDSFTGKRRQYTKTFMQTLNPYNRNQRGGVKTREEIYREINKEADEWLKEKAPMEAPLK